MILDISLLAGGRMADWLELHLSQAAHCNPVTFLTFLFIKTVYTHEKNPGMRTCSQSVHSIHISLYKYSKQFTTFRLNIYIYIYI